MGRSGDRVATRERGRPGDGEGGGEGLGPGPDSGSGNDVALGRLGGAWGVRGWLRVESFTDPADAVLDYRRWTLVQPGREPLEVTPREGRLQGQSLVVHLEGIDDRDAALALRGSTVTVPRSALPPAGEGEHYWTDLVGLEVVNVEGVSLGRIEGLFETGANDVMVVRGDRERLLPYVPDQVVLRVDVAAGRMEVDWQPDW